MQPSDKIYVVLPISHIVGISLLIMTLMAGGTVRLVSKYDPAALAKAIAEEGITILNGVPATYQRLSNTRRWPASTQLDRGSLRLICGGRCAARPRSEVARRTASSACRCSNGYGITECSPGISGVRFDAPRSDQAVGTVLPGVEARIRTIDGIPVGEWRGRRTSRARPQRDARLLPRPDLTAKAIDPEGWFNTGDLARFDGDCLYIVGRTKEMIIRSGFNVYPAEVEAVLNSHKAVVQSRRGRPRRRRQ